VGVQNIIKMKRQTKKKCNCNKYNCLLEFIYPNSDAGLACDSECYFEQRGNETHLKWYIEHYPEKYKKFLEAVNTPKNETHDRETEE
jgi:hypothetical protein